MGVKHFYLWYRQHFSRCLSSRCPQPIGTLAIDMNGLFHLCAQKVFQYGNGAHPPHTKREFRDRRGGFPTTSLLRPPTGGSPTPTTTVSPPCPPDLTDLYREICTKLNDIVHTVHPTECLLLCVDGVAGLGKMNQQRQRRFRASMESNSRFDPNLFTPGTQLMDHLTRYIDWYLRQMMSHDPYWQTLEVIFSNEKVAGEGEHKIMNYIRRYGKRQETFCIYGLDADLVMLSFLLPVDRVVIAREADYQTTEYVDVALFKQELMTLLRWDTSSVLPDRQRPFRETDAIHDFVVLSFLVGNDFLPTIPTLAIIDGFFSLVMEIYHEIGQTHGHLTYRPPRSTVYKLRIPAIKEFMKRLGELECFLILKRYEDCSQFTPDPIFQRHIDVVQNARTVRLLSLKDEYYAVKFSENPTSSSPSVKEQRDDIIRQYLNGMQWILQYYTVGMPDWHWFYPFLYAPFCSDIYQFLSTENYQVPPFVVHEPVPTFLQLMMVLPPSNRHFLPKCLGDQMQTDPRCSPLAPFYQPPRGIDMGGKKKDWEGVVLLPPVHLPLFYSIYQHFSSFLTAEDKKRNRRGKTFLYRTIPPSSSASGVSKTTTTATPLQVTTNEIII